MADYLPPVVVELEGRDEKFARMLDSAKGRLDRFLAQVAAKKATVRVDADITPAKAALDRWRAQERRMGIELKVTAKLERASTDELRRRIQAMSPVAVEAKVKPVFDRDQARRVNAYLDAFKDPVKVPIKPVLDRDAARRVMAYLDAFRDPVIAPIRAELDPDRAARTRQRIEELTRDRTMVIRARVTTTGSGGSRAAGRTARNLGPDLSGIAALGTPIAAGAAALANPAILAAVGALTAGFAASGVAVGAFGLAAAHQFSGISASADAAAKAQKAETTAARKATEAHALAATGGKAYKQALTSAASAARASKDAQLAYKQSLAGLPVATQATAMALFKLKSAYGKWSDGLAKDTMPVFTGGLKLATSLLPKLTPLVRVGATALTDFENRLAGEAGGGGFDRFIAKISKASSVVLPDLLSSAHDVFSGVGGILGAFLPDAGKVSTSMTIMAQKFAKLGQGMGNSAGFASFMDDARKNAPMVEKAVSDIAKAFGRLGGAMGPLSGSTVQVIDILAQGISKIPVPVLNAIATVLPYIIIGTKAWTLAQLMLSAAMDANPVGAILLGIAALAGAVVFCWKNFQGFRNVVMDVFASTAVAAGMGVNLIVGFLKTLADTTLTTVGYMLSALGHLPGFGWAKQAGKDVLGFKRTVDSTMDGITRKVNSTVASANQQKVNVVMRGRIEDLNKKIADAKRQLNAKNLPDSKRVTLTADINNWTDQANKARMAMAATPSGKRAVLTATVADWTAKIAAANKALASAPASKRAVLSADISDLTRKKQMAQAELDSLRNKTVTITAQFRSVGSGSAKASLNANGAIYAGNVKRFAAGGFEDHSAQIAPAGAMRLWAEPETGGESYIPHAASKRARSRVIAAKTVGILGGQVSWGAGGSGAAGAAASYAHLGAAIPAGVAAGVSGSAGAAHAAVRALAKGTVQAFSAELGIASPSKKFRSLGAYVTFGLVQGLTGSTASVRAASKRIASALYVAFGSGHAHLQATVAKDSRALLTLAARRDAVAVRLRAANKQLAAVQKQWAAEQRQVADSIMQSSSVVMDASQNNGWLSATQVVQNFAQQQQKALQFAGFLRQAQALGLNAAMVQQIASSGVDAGYATAQALASANKDQISQLNGMQKNMQGAANGVGSAVADAMYGAGIKSAQGLVKGLKSQERAIEAQMMRIAKAMQAAIKRALGIKSPSRVFEGLGQYIPQGLARGITRDTHHATGAVMSMSRAVAGAGHRSYAYAGSHGAGGGGTTVINNYKVEVTVQGSVTSERNLADVVQARLLRKGANNSQTYQAFER